jgi:dynein heavy chain
VQEEWLPRVRLQFVAEDPQNFAQRFAAAVHSRRQAESMLVRRDPSAVSVACTTLTRFAMRAQKYNLYVDSMLTDGIPTLPSAHIDSMLARSVPSKAAARSSQLRVLEEVQAAYSRSMNKIVFDEHLADPAQADLRDSLDLPPPPVAEVPQCVVCVPACVLGWSDMYPAGLAWCLCPRTTSPACCRRLSSTRATARYPAIVRSRAQVLMRAGAA